MYCWQAQPQYDTNQHNTTTILTNNNTTTILTNNNATTISTITTYHRWEQRRWNHHSPQNNALHQHMCNYNSDSQQQDIIKNPFIHHNTISHHPSISQSIFNSSQFNNKKTRVTSPVTSSGLLISWNQSSLNTKLKFKVTFNLKFHLHHVEQKEDKCWNVRK